MVGAGLRAELAQDALAALFDEVYATRHRRVREDELERAKVLILSESAYQKETVQGEARKIGFYEVVGGDWRFEDAYRDRLRALTVDDVREAARRYFTDAPAIVLQTHDASVSPTTEVMTEVARERFRRAESRRPDVPKRGALDVTRITLDSGAVLLVKEEPSPVVAIRAVALGGQRYEARQRSGIGNLFSCIWGQSTLDLTPEALAQRMADLGGAVSAFSGRNVTGMRGEFIAERTREGLQLFADTLVRPRFTKEDLDRERAVLLERIKSRLDSPGSVAFDVFAETLFPGHPYGMSGLGSAESLNALGLDDVVAHGSRFVTPDKLVIAVVGNASAASVLELVADALESTGSASQPLPAAPPVQARPSTPTSSKRRMEKQQCHVIVGSLGTTVAHADRFALEVLTTILSGQSGRLFLDLRDKQSLAYSVSSSNVEGLDPGHVLVHMGTSPEKVERGLAGIYGHLARLRDELVPAPELERARRYLVGTNAIDLQRCGARAMLMALGELYRLGYDDYTRYAERINAVTAADVQRVARAYFAPESLVEVVVGPVA
jgi:zinc protease